MTKFYFRAFTRNSIAPADTIPPTVPGGFSVSLTGNTPTLSWTASTDNVAVAGYQIDASYASGAFSQIATTTSLGYSDKGAPQNTLCAYKIQAFDPSANVSGFTSTQSVTTPSTSTADITPPPVPAQPTLVTQNNAAGTYEMSWLPVTDVIVAGAVTSGTAGYQIFVDGSRLLPDLPQPSGATSARVLTDIGSPATAGADNGSVLTANGNNHYGTSDQFSINSVPIQGDFTVTMEITAMTGTYQWAKGGLEARSTLDPASAYFNAFFFPTSSGNGLQSEYRLLPSAQAAQIMALAISLPCLVRIQRQGSTLTAAYSTNISSPSYTVYNTQTFSNLPAVMQVGNFGCGNTTGATMSMSYASLSINGASPVVFNGMTSVGTHSFAVKSFDNAGNVSAPSTAQSVTITSSSVTSRGASYLIGSTPYYQSFFINQAAKESFSLLDQFAGWDGAQPSGSLNRAQICAAVQAINPNWTPVNYIDAGLCGSFFDTVYRSRCTTYKFFLLSTYPSGTLVTVNGGPNALNIANSVADPTDPNGRDTRQFLNDYVFDVNKNGGTAGLCTGTNVANPAFAAILLDDMNAQLTTNGDWLRNGTTQSNGDGSGAEASVRQGWVKVIQKFQSNGIKVFGNIANAQGPSNIITELVGTLDGQILEGFQGEFYSPGIAGTGQTFTDFLAAYQKRMTLLMPGGRAIFGISNLQSNGSIPDGNWNFSTAQPTSWYPAFQGIRAACGMCFVLGDAYVFPCASSSNSSAAPTYSGQPGNYIVNSISDIRWFQFFAVDPTTGVAISYASATAMFAWLGTWVDAAQTTKWLNQGTYGIWRRRGSVGTVFLNPPGNGPQTVALGATYNVLTCTDDPTMAGGTITTWNAQGSSTQGDALFVRN